LRSTLRQQCLPGALPRLPAFSACGAPFAGPPFPEAFLGGLFDFLRFSFRPGGQFFAYPVPGPGNDLRRGHRRYTVVWSRPAQERSELKQLLTDEPGVTHSISIPPPLIRRDATADMRAAAERLLPPQFRAVVKLIDEPILQPIYDLESEEMAFGRIAIMGDAAFVARPHVAAGVAKAADDAAALAAAVDKEDVQPGL